MKDDQPVQEPSPSSAWASSVPPQAEDASVMKSTRQDRGEDASALRDRLLKMIIAHERSRKATAE